MFLLIASLAILISNKKPSKFVVTHFFHAAICIVKMIQSFFEDMSYKNGEVFEENAFYVFMNVQVEYSLTTVNSEAHF